jgi:endonuclease-8
MPEGPSIVILKELTDKFKGKTIIEATGNAKFNKAILLNKKITDFKSWGKHFLICLPSITIRIHFLLFGSYSINEKIKPDQSIRLHLHFKQGELYFYTCAVKIIEEPLDEIYDWSADVMNSNWTYKKAMQKLKKNPGMLVCDALLNQEIFAGVGNIIKNEVLYRVKIHPKSLIDKIPSATLKKMVEEARNYSFDFLKWKKAFELKKHWLAYSKKTCSRCDLPFEKDYLGRTKRKSFFCSNCQKLYK